MALDHKPYTPEGNMRLVWKARELEVLVDGPAGTGKTLGICELCHALCRKHPGTRILWAMSRRVDLTETILVTFEAFVIEEGLRITDGASRATRRSYVYPNGSEIILRGLDDVERTRGLEVSMIVEFEATNITEDDHETLLRCLRWKKGLPYKRVICDTNPGPPQHWLLNRVNSGVMRRIPSRHQDNPRFWDPEKECWTEEGDQYVNHILGAMTGTRRKRLKDGLWVADENAVFDLDVLQRHRNDHGADPWLEGNLWFEQEGTARDVGLRTQDVDGIDLVEAGPAEKADWKLWLDLVRDAEGRMRPPQDETYVLAMDVGMGQGASNTTISVGARTARRKVAEFASAAYGPEEAARILVGAALWFGGQKPAFKIWEANGPGGSVSKIVIQVLSQSACYLRRTQKTGRSKPTEAGEAGWWSDDQSKIDLAMDLREAYALGTYINPSRASIDETMAYIRYPSGHIGPARLVAESPDAKKTHGDRTIADMLLVHGMAQAPLFKAAPPKPPVGSVAWDLAQQKAAEKKQERW